MTLYFNARVVFSYYTPLIGSLFNRVFAIKVKRAEAKPNHLLEQDGGFFCRKSLRLVLCMAEEGLSLIEGGPKGAHYATLVARGRKARSACYNRLSSMFKSGVSSVRYDHPSPLKPPKKRYHTTLINECLFWGDLLEISCC